jgi:hypothetical protein
MAGWRRTAVTELEQQQPEALRDERLDGVEVECTHCGVRMASHVGNGERVRYFRCGSCQRWVSSVYTEVFRGDAKMRMHPKRPESERNAQFDQVKDRLERWLAALEDQDPYRVLGVSPLDSEESIRDRYRELALAHHPDRGGSMEKMREINVAYEKIVLHRERRQREQLAEGRRSVVLPEAG